MMRWEVFIIPLIALGVWILGTIFRNAEEERQKLGARRPGGGRGPSRRPTTDLDRFLEEARRRREQMEKRETADKKEPPPSERAPTPRPPRPRREMPAPERRSPRPREAPIPVAEVVRPPRAMPAEMQRVPVAAAFQPPVPVAPARVIAEAVVVPAPPAPVQVEEVVVATVVPTAPCDRAPSSSRAQVFNLLRNPSTRGAAFVLSEVLRPPLCRRRHR